MASGLDAFARRGSFYRGNLHTHSTRSDGARSPEEVCAFYREAGYDFLCLSDHFLPRFGHPITDTRGARTNRFTTIAGAEVHAGTNSQGEIWHLLAVGLPEDFAPPDDGESGEALAARAKSAGAFVGIAHPQWSSLTIEDGRAMAPHAHAVEVYNTSSDLETGRPDGAAFLDALLNEGFSHLTAYAADDAHFKLADHGHAAIMVKAAANQPDELLAAMKAGLSYSTTGPLIDGMELSGATLRVACQQPSTVAAVGRGSRAVTTSANPETDARLDVGAFAGDWFRVVVIDEARRVAWSNPVFAP